MAKRRRRPDPEDKKARSYRKDYRIADEDPQQFRRAWPRKKALRNQTYRRRLHRSLRRALDTAHELSDVAPAPVRRVLSKWTRQGGAVPLGEWVRWKRATRLHRIAWNFFKEPYDSPCHRLPFARFLASLTEGRSAYAAELAAIFRGVLAGQGPMDQSGDFSRYHRFGDDAPAWLHQFFRDEPAWEPRLRAWIAGTRQHDGANRGRGGRATAGCPEAGEVEPGAAGASEPSAGTTPPPRPLGGASNPKGGAHARDL